MAWLFTTFTENSFDGNAWTWFWWSWICQVVLTANIDQPPTNSSPVHPHLSCLIPLLPYTNCTSWERHSFRHFSLYSIHFTGMTCLDPCDIRAQIPKCLNGEVFILLIWGRIQPVPLSLVSFDQSTHKSISASRTSIWLGCHSKPDCSTWNFKMTGWPVLEIEFLWIVSLFNQDLANTVHAKYIKIPQSLVITNFNRMNASGNQCCIALPFVVSLMILMSLSRGCVFCNFFTPSPLMTPSSPNTKPSPIHRQSCLLPNSGSSDWSSVSGPRPEPGRRHMT